MIDLSVFLRSVGQTREYGMISQSDCGVRARYNRNEKSQYSIRDGKWQADAAPAQMRAAGIVGTASALRTA